MLYVYSVAYMKCVVDGFTHESTLLTYTLSFAGRGDTGDGGDVTVVAGETTAAASIGGTIVLTAGLGSSTNSGDGGNGGSVLITGGEGRGAASEDYGGNVETTGGKAEGGTGGSIFITSGASVMTSSGSVHIETVNSGNVGVSGTFWISSGSSSMGNSGFIALCTGDATGGKGGDFSAHVGTGDTGPGGEISVRAGKSIDPTLNSVGGHVDIETGALIFTMVDRCVSRASMAYNFRSFHIPTLYRLQ